MKYKFTGETKKIYERTLHRIVCETAFANVKAGDLGGWIEDERNLSQDGNAWVRGEALVCGGARVFDDAIVGGNAKIGGKALVFENARVQSSAKIGGYAKISGKALVGGNAKIDGSALVEGNAIVGGNALVYGRALVCGDATVGGKAEIYGGAVVLNNGDFIVLKNNWSSGRYFTYTMSNDKWKVGCFHGSGEELIAKAYKDGKLIGDCYKAAVEFVEKIKENLQKAKAAEEK